MTEPESMTSLYIYREAITDIVNSIENEQYLIKMYTFVNCLYKKELEVKSKNNE